MDSIRALHRFGSHDVMPDRTLVLVLDDGAERARMRDSSGADRIGGRAGDYHRAVEAAFRDIAASEPERVRLIDAAGSPAR